MKQIEVEGGEISLKNSHGDIVIIPKNKANWVKQKLSEGCHGCIDGLVESLPSMKDYAGDGSIFPSWNTVKSTLNPNNWGVDDYSSEKDFNSAYVSAKKKGDEEFMYKDKRYNTKYAGTPRQEVGRYGINGKVVHPLDINYPSQVNIYPAFGKYLPGHISASIYDNQTSIDSRPKGNMPYGLDRVDNKGEKSYNVYGNDSDKFMDKVINTPSGDYMIEEKYTPSDWNLFTNNCADAVCNAFDIPKSKLIETPSNALNKIKNKYPTIESTKRTADDYYDLSNSFLNKVTSYGRNVTTLNYKNDSKEILKQSKNLIGIRNSPDIINTRTGKNIVLALQLSLHKEGYKLPKSTTKEGEFDGVYGDETKNALTEYQKTLNTKK